MCKSQSYPLLFLLVTLLASCKIGQEYQQPSVGLPQQFGTVSFADTSSIADIAWRGFFTDPTLQALIERGLSNNHDLLIAINRIDIAQQYVHQAKALPLRADAQMAARIDFPSENSLGGISTTSFLGQRYLENYNAGVTLSWEIDVWRKIRNQKAATLADYLQNHEAAKAVQTQLVADIAQGYFNLLMLDRQLDIARKNLALADSFLIATRLLKDAGSGNALVVQQAESQRQSTAILIPQLEQDVALQENALQILTGSLPGEISRTAALTDVAISEKLSTGLPAAIVSRRPDVRSAEMGLVALNARIGIAQANMYPAFNIIAGGGLEAFKAENWFKIPGSIFGFASGAIVQPILNRKELKTEYEVAKLEREQAVIRFRQAVLQAVGEVSDALVQIEELAQQQQIARAQVETLDGAVFNARLLFRSDMANYLEVISAQGGALLAELNLASIQRQQLSARVELYRALGGGWK